MFWADLIIGLDSLGKYGLCPILKNQFLLDGPAEKNIRTEFPEQHPGAYSSFGSGGQQLIGDGSRLV